MGTTQISFDHATHQWFIAQNIESGTQIFHTIDNNQYHYQLRINELLGRRIRACFHGWVILSNHPDNCLWSLWNPLTSTLIRLPPLSHRDHDSYECCLSAPPDEQGSVLLLTTPEAQTIVFCRLDRKRKRLKWTAMSYAKQLRNINTVDNDSVLQSPTCCNGKVYAMALGHYHRSVIQVAIAVKGKEEVVISLLPFVKVPSTTSSYNRCPRANKFYKISPFLKGSCTDLFYINVCFKDATTGAIGDVNLLKLDVTSMIWEEIADLKDAVFFLQLASGYSACYCTSAANSAVGGYVHILGEPGNVMYSFCAKDRTIAITSIPGIVLESQASTWAMLDWRLEVDHVEFKQEEENKDTAIIVKGDKTDFDSESRLLDIPNDILEVIMELCVGVEYTRLRATCKHCYLAAPPIQSSSKATLRRLQAYSLVSPLLLVLDNYRGIITLIDPTRDDRYFIKVPPELKGNYQIYCCRYGWLLLYDLNGSMAFFNPFTGIIRELPLAPYLESFCFSAPPTSPDCMVVGFTTFGEWPVYFHFVSRDTIWRKCRLNFGGDDPYSYRFPVFKGRDLYVLCNNTGLDVFKEMAEDDYSWEVVVDKAPPSDCESPRRYFLSNCDQHPLLVVVSEFGESVEVFKVNESTFEWEKIENLGKHMIYVSDTSCIYLEEAKSPEMENKIYFPRLLNNAGTKIVFYSLDTCRFHTFNDKQGFGVDLLGTKQHCQPHTWIEPSWS